jgi:hypothetical protein
VLIVRRKDGVSLKWGRCFRIAEMLEKIVNRFALGVDGYGRPVVLKRLRGYLLMRWRLGRFAYRGNWGRN